MKFNRLLLLISLFFAINQASAQEVEAQESEFQTLFPRSGDFGLSLQLSGLIDKISLGTFDNNYGNNIIFGKYYISDKKVLRLGFGLDILAQKRERVDSVGQTLVESDSSASQYFINISFGYEQHLSASRRLDPYLFGQIDLTFIGKHNINKEERTTSGAGTASIKDEIKEDGGLAFGLSAGGGFNYFLAERFSIGVELALQIQYIKEGGTISETRTVNPINGNPVVVINSRENLLKTTDIGVRPQAIIQLSYFF
jgi:hypothetical protein